MGSWSGAQAVGGALGDWESEWAGAPDADAEPREPKEALMVPRAGRHLLLDVARAGEGLVAVGDQGVIVRSTDGDDWEQVASPVDVMLVKLHFRDDRNGWVVGHDGVVMRTDDGGANWTLQRWSPGDRTLYDVLFLSEREGLAVGGYGTLLHTVDGGETWDALEPDIAWAGLHFNRIVQLGDGSLFIAGERGLLAYSDDGGRDWQMLDGPYTGSWFGAVPIGERGVLVHGLRGNVYVANDVSEAQGIDADDWDEYTRETVTDAEELAELGWRRLRGQGDDRPGTASLFGGVAIDGGALLVGVNGVAVRADVDSGRLHALSSGEDATLNTLIMHEGRWLGVGRRGARVLDDIDVRIEGENAR